MGSRHFWADYDQPSFDIMDDKSFIIATATSRENAELVEKALNAQARVAELEAVNARFLRGIMAMAAYLPPPNIVDAAGVTRAFHYPNAAQHLLRMRDAFNKVMKPDA